MRSFSVLAVHEPAHPSPFSTRHIRRTARLVSLVPGRAYVDRTAGRDIRSSSPAEERAQLGMGLLRGFLWQVVSTLEWPAVHFLGPPTPDVEDVIVPLEESLTAPEDEHRALHATARLAVFGVVLVVEGGRRPVILTSRVDGLRITEKAHILCKCLRGEKLTAPSEEGFLRFSGEQALRQVIWLGEEEPVPVTQAKCHVRPGEGLPCGHDVQDRQLGDDTGVVEGHAIADAPAAVVAAKS